MKANQRVYISFVAQTRLATSEASLRSAGAPSVSSLVTKVLHLHWKSETLHILWLVSRLYLVIFLL